MKMPQMITVQPPSEMQEETRQELVIPELGKCPVHFASATGDLRSLQLLFANERNRADPNALVKNSGRTALHICAENGKVSLL